MPQRIVKNGLILEVNPDGTGTVVGYAGTPAPAATGRVFSLPPSAKDIREQQRQDAADARAQRADQRAAAAEARAEKDFESKDTMVPAPGDTTKTGEDYLATVPPSLAAQARALIDGRRAFPTGSALRSPAVQELIAVATQADPTIDAANAATRVATRKDFTSGKSAQNITALNTVIGHLGSLYQSANDLHNRGLKPWNALANAAEANTVGFPALKGFNLSRQAVADEMERVWRQAGGNVSEIQQWRDSFGSSSTPAEFREAVGKAMELLNSRLESLSAQYGQGMGKSVDGITFLKPHAQEIFQHLSIGGDGQLPPAPQGPSNGNPPPPGGNGTITPTNGQQQTRYDPRMSSHIDAMMNAGASLPMINAALGKRNLPPITPGSYAEAKAWMAKNPGQKYFGSNINRTEDLSLGQKALAVPAVGAAATLGARAADAGSAGILGALAGEDARGTLDAAGQLHPDAAILGDTAGGIAGAFGGEALAGKALANVPRALKYAPVLGDMLYGGTLGFNRAQDGEGGVGAVEGAGGALAGNLLMKGLGGAVRGVTDPAVQLLRSKGIPLTVGQTVGNSGLLGRLVRGAEDRMSGFWGVGDVVKARQREGVEALAGRMANDAVAPIGGTASGYGQGTVDDLLQQGGNAYDAATAGAHVPLDPQFGTDLAAVRALGAKLPDDLSARFGRAIDNRVAPIEDAGALTGDTFQQAIRGLKGYRAETPKPGFEQDYRDALGQGIDALRGQMVRGGGQDVVDNLANADQAWKNIKVFERATTAARNGSRSGEVGLPMPSQFNDAATASAAKYGGPRFNGDLLDAAQGVLPNKVADSGTAGRLAFGAGITGLSGAALGGGAGALAGDTQTGAETGLGLTLLLAAGGSKPAQRAAVKLLADRPDVLRKAGNLIYDKGWVGSGALSSLLTGSQ